MDQQQQQLELQLAQAQRVAAESLARAQRAEQDNAQLRAALAGVQAWAATTVAAAQREGAQHARTAAGAAELARQEHAAAVLARQHAAAHLRHVLRKIAKRLREIAPEADAVAEQVAVSDAEDEDADDDETDVDPDTLIDAVEVGAIGAGGMVAEVQVPLSSDVARAFRLPFDFDTFGKVFGSGARAYAEAIAYRHEHTVTKKVKRSAGDAMDMDPAAGGAAAAAPQLQQEEVLVHTVTPTPAFRARLEREAIAHLYLMAGVTSHRATYFKKMLSHKLLDDGLHISKLGLLEHLGLTMSPATMEHAPHHGGVAGAKGHGQNAHAHAQGQQHAEGGSAQAASPAVPSAP